MSANTIGEFLRAKTAQVRSLNPIRAQGVVAEVVGSVVESEGPLVSLGDLCEMETADGGKIRTQVVGFRGNRVVSMPLDEGGQLQLGSPIVARGAKARAPVGASLLGRVVDAFGAPIDGAGPLSCSEFRHLYRAAPGPMEREPIAEPLATGVRVIDGLLTCGKGQRVGIFGGSGVGKSTLLGALARNSSAQVNVIGLIGERNREVRGFVEETLGPEGLREIGCRGRDLGPAGSGAGPRGVSGDDDRRVFPGSRNRCTAHHGLGNKVCHGPKRDRPGGWRAAEPERIHSVLFPVAAKDLRTRRELPQRDHYRVLH